MRRNWIAGCLGIVGLALMGYASLSPSSQASFAPELASTDLQEYPVVGTSGDEAPLFESQSGLSEAFVPGDEPVAGAFDTVSFDHWVVQALRDVFPEDLTHLPAGETPRTLTRYELAVALARVFESYEKTPERDQVLDLPRVALLEKLGEELRGELSLLGVNQGTLRERIDQLHDRVGSVESRVEQHGGRIQSLEEQVVALLERVDGQEQGALELAQRLDSARKARQKLERKGEAVSKVVSRLVVKTAVASVQKGTGAGEAGAAAKALEERVRKLEEKGGEGGSNLPPRVAERMGERLRRLERLVVKSFTERRKDGPSRTDAIRISTLRLKMNELQRRLERYRETRLEVAHPGVGGQALDEVKELMKGFFSDFDRRLGSVEKQML